MEDIFQNTESEKKEKIINSALEEFSKNSFDQASTNNIVENAGISKGLLYHYFDSKKSLYEYLEVFAIKTMIDAIEKKVDWEQSDIFQRIKEIAIIKFKVFLKYPYLIEFSKTIYEDKSIDQLKKMVEDYSPEIYSEVYYRNIDFSLFKDELDIKKVIKITQWVMEKLGEEWMNEKEKINKDFDVKELMGEIDDYLKLLKNAFYK